LFPRQHIQLTQLHHRIGKAIEEQFLIGSKGLHNPFCPRVAKQVLVRGEQALPIRKVHVVLVVENVRGSHVQHRRVRSLRTRTRIAQVLRQGRLDWWVRLVDPAEECGAVGPPECVRAGERHHVGGAEISGRECFEELAGSERRRWKVSCGVYTEG